MPDLPKKVLRLSNTNDRSVYPEALSHAVWPARKLPMFYPLTVPSSSESRLSTKPSKKTLRGRMIYCLVVYLPL